MKCKVRPFVLRHSLFTSYNCVYAFIIRLFSNIFQTVLRSSRRRICRKFQVPSLGNKSDFNYRNKREEILKVLRGQLFLGHPLCFYDEEILYSYTVTSLLGTKFSSPSSVALLTALIFVGN